MSAQAAGFESCYWVTYKKAQDLGGQVRKGEKSSIAVFWKKLEKEKVSDSGSIIKDEFFVLRYYRVFNLDQCDDLDPDKLPVDAVPEIDETELDFEPIAACESIVDNMPNSQRLVTVAILERITNPCRILYICRIRQSLKTSLFIILYCFTSYHTAPVTV